MFLKKYYSNLSMAFSWVDSLTEVSYLVGRFTPISALPETAEKLKIQTQENRSTLSKTIFCADFFTVHFLFEAVYCRKERLLIA